MNVGNRLPGEPIETGDDPAGRREHSTDDRTSEARTLERRIWQLEERNREAERERAQSESQATRQRLDEEIASRDKKISELETALEAQNTELTQLRTPRPPQTVSEQPPKPGLRKNGKLAGWI